jgi:class 3 adenylate cyclase/predicted ATPase
VDIGAWLRQLGLERYEQAFRDNEVDFDILSELAETDLEELGVLWGDRKKLLDAIIELAPPDQATAGTAGPPPDIIGPGVERRQLTVMFCELVGLTELDPEDLSDLMLTYRKRCTDVVTHWDGHVAKIVGDGMLAYFGWPRANEDDAERAVRAGLALVDAVSKLTTAADEALVARVGIATGLVMVGDLMPTGAAREEVVVGQTPNLAARLRELARPGAVVIAPTTRRLVGRLFELTDLGAQHLKGFAEPLSAWQVEGQGRAEGRFEARQTTDLMPMVGREEEIALLLRRWRQAQGGEGQVVLLSGEPGIGKSRLVRELRERIAAQPHLRVTHQCSPYHQTSPLHPVVTHLERAAGFERDDPTEARLAKLEALLAGGTDKLDQAVPMIAALLGIPTGERYPALELTPQRQKELTLEALLDQLAGLAAEQPVLVVHEDVHWIDPTTLELLTQTIEKLSQIPALLVVTFRPEFTPPWAGQPHVSALALNRLGRRDGASMVERVVGAKALPAEVSAHILAKTDGVPLFVEELTKAVLESGLLTDAGDHYELCGPLRPLAIPATLHDSLLARLDHLAPVKEVAQIGAAIGREFSHALLVAVADRPEPELHAALDQLVQSELIFRRGAPSEATYSFKHVLVQDAAYGTLLKSRRQQLHARIAQVLEEQFPDLTEAQPELLANHCAEAGLIETAVQYWQRAGQQAIARSAMAEAIAQLTKGIALLARLPDVAERRRRELGLQLTLGRALHAGCGTGVPETGRAYARAAELCEQTGETSLLVPALYGLIVFHFSRAELAPALALAKRALAVAELEDIPARVAGHFSIGWVNLALGRLGAAREHLERALELHATAQQPSFILTYGIDVRVKCLAYLSWALLILGHPDQARARSRDALLEAERLRQPFTIGFAFHRALTVLQLYREVPAVAESVTAMLALGREQGFPIYVAAGTFNRGWLLVQDGFASKGVALMREALNALRANRDEDFLPYSLALLAEAHGKVGQTAAALVMVDEALAWLERTDQHLFEAELHRLKGELLLVSSGADQAEACLGRAIEVARAQDAKLWELRAATSLARLWAVQGRRAEAHDLLVPVYGWFTEGLDTADLKDAKALLDEPR